jgi:23S rRNA pseudouridine2605 synthase
MPAPAVSSPRPLAGARVRLQRLLADAGVAARRACERLIEEGRVTVNGRVVRNLPAFVDPESDRIVVGGRVVSRPARRLYVMLNKPERVLTVTADEPGADRATIRDLVRHPSGARLYPVGRLEYDATGLVLLTNDGPLAHRLTHPRFGAPKTYRVTVKGPVSPDALPRLSRALARARGRAARTLAAPTIAGGELVVLGTAEDRTVLGLTLREGRVPHLRTVLARAGHPVRKMEQVAIGPLRLSGVARGQWRELTREEVQALRRAVRSVPGQRRAGRRGQEQP